MNNRSKSLFNILAFFALLVSMLGGVLTFTPAHATAVSQTHTVNTNADTNDGSCDALGTGAGSQDCTLREAIANAASGDTIVFDSALSGGTITLSSSLSLFSDVTIDGSTLASQLTISGNDTVGIFYIHTNVIATLDSLKLVNGNSSYGGAISAYGILTVNNSTFADNSASAFGGAIYAQDSTTLISNSTFSGNHADFYGGVISQNNGNVSVVNSTFSGNDADQFGGSIYFQGATGTGTLNLSNSTISDSISGYGAAIYGNSGALLNFANTIIANSTGGDCFSIAIGTNTNNLVEDGNCSASLSGDPKLDLLANNGGSTQTFALLAGSPAIDAGTNTGCPVTDQRGVTRDAACDIGAFEFINSAPTDIGLSNSSIAENQSIGALVGNLTTTDPDVADTHTYTFCGGVDDASFALVGDALNTAAVFDYETKNAYNICIRTDDGYGGTFDKAFIITVTDVNETLTATFRSVGNYDGWTLESLMNSNMGGTLDKTAATFNLGDEVWDRQYRAILHFNTSTLPDTAVITKVTLNIRKQGLVGTDPFTILGGLKVDMSTPFFGLAYGLEIGDFEALAGKAGVAIFGATPTNNWYSALLSAQGRAYVNKTGNTQFRLRFATDDNNDNGADYMKFYSGDYATAAARPTLVIEYYEP